MREVSRIAVLAVDPALGDELTDEALATARRVLTAQAFALDPGAWTPPGDLGAGGHLGLLVVEGLMIRDVTLAASEGTELLGAGDLLRPWQEDGEYAALRFEVSWTVLEPVRLALLDRRFAHGLAHFPPVLEALMSRAVRRSRALSAYLAIGHVTRVDVRVLLLLWHLADRWGEVSPDGVRLRLPLTHDRLAQLVGAKRPSVTTAVGELARRGLVERRARDTWILHGDPANALAQADELPLARELDALGGGLGQDAAVAD